jgi:hypothetical protein
MTGRGVAGGGEGGTQARPYEGDVWKIAEVQKVGRLGAWLIAIRV